MFSQYDVVFVGHVHFVVLTALALTFRPRGRPRVLMVAHGIDVWGAVRGLRRRAVRRVDRILCVSDYTRRSLQTQAPEIEAARFTIFPNALDAAWTTSPESALQHRDRVSDDPSPFLLSVGRLDVEDRTKGIITTMEALAGLNNQGVRYVIAGKGEDLPVLQGVAERLGIAKRVRFAGAVSDAELIELYRSCLAFVLPSGQEGFGIVFLEAMLFGAPVVAASEKGALDVITNGETGLLVRYGDVVELRAALERLLSVPSLRAQLALRGCQQVTGDGQFTFDAFAERWRTAIEP